MKKKISVLVLIIGFVLIGTGVYMGINAKNVKQISENRQNDQREIALKIILDSSPDKKNSDFKYIEKTEDGKYKYQDISITNERIEEYYIVNIEDKSYILESHEVKGG